MLRKIYSNRFGPKHYVNARFVKYGQRQKDQKGSKSVGQ